MIYLAEQCAGTGFDISWPTALVLIAACAAFAFGMWVTR